MKKAAPIKKITQEVKSNLPEPLYHGCYFKVEGLPLYFLITKHKEIHYVGPGLRNTIFKQCSIEVSIDFFVNLFPSTVKLKPELDPNQTHLWQYYDADAGEMKYLFENNKNLNAPAGTKKRSGAKIEIETTTMTAQGGQVYYALTTVSTGSPFNFMAAATLPTSSLPDIDTGEAVLKYPL